MPGTGTFRIGRSVLLALTPMLAEVARADDDSWSFEVEGSAGIEYDDNISVTELDVNTAQDDFKAVLDASLGVENEFGQGTEFDLSYNFSQSLHFDFTQFDIQTHRISANLEHDFGDTSVGALYNFSYATLGGDGFLTLQQISPFVSSYLGKKVLVRAAYEYRNKEFKDRIDRDADVHAGGVDVYIFINGIRTFVLAGYKYENQDATAPQFDFTGHNLKARFSQRFRIGKRDAELKLGWRYEARNYDAITPAIDAIRDDDRHKFQAELEIPVNEYFYLAFDYEYSDFSSNLPAANYTQNLASIRAGVEF